MEAIQYNNTGKEVGKVALPESIFGVKWNADLVHQVVTSMMSNARAGTADTKGRGEVRGGGKKPWKQKGTGRARHGSSRSPIWKGGGVTHGPLAEKNYDKKINKKMKTKALYTILSQKLREGEILFIDSIASTEGKTKQSAQTFAALSKLKGFNRLAGKKEVALVVFPEVDMMSFRSMKNLPQATFDLAKDINPVDLMSHRYIVVVRPLESLKVLEARTLTK